MLQVRASSMWYAAIEPKSLFILLLSTTGVETNAIPNAIPNATTGMTRPLGGTSLPEAKTR